MANAVEITINKPLREVLRDAEAHYIATVLNAFRGNKKLAAEAAGETYVTFCRKCKTLEDRMTVQFVVNHGGGDV